MYERNKLYALRWYCFEKFSVPTRVGSNILLILACRCMVLRTAICQLYALIQYNAYLIVSRINYIRCTFNSTGNLKNTICRWLMTVHNNSVQINSIHSIHSPTLILKLFPVFDMILIFVLIWIIHIWWEKYIQRLYVVTIT